MSVSSPSLDPNTGETNPSPLTSRTGLPPALEVLLITALFGGLMIGASVYQVPFGAQIALISCVIAITVFQRLRGETWVDLGFKGPRNVSGFLLGTLAVFAIIASTFGANAVLQPTLAALLGNEGAQRVLPSVETWAEYIRIMVIVWTTAAFAEEMVFRGFFMTRIADVFGRSFASWTIALFAPAVMFGLAHLYQGLPGVITTGTVGLVFGIWYLISRRNLLPVIIAHGVVNSIGMTVLFAVSQGLLSADSLGL